MSDSALTKQLAYEACMNIFYGEKINKHFGDRLLEVFGPSIARVAEQTTIDGYNRDAALDAVATTAVAMVAGMRAVLKEINSSQMNDQQSHAVQMEKAHLDQQTQA
ncbi:hypothetical protein [Raoultella planticola]|uniref:hypothetical protein n=1 Tax=Raoultella planticola TaxID=575 RepID=UPI00093698C1|nr:hypothetical protein [Raoultella planticola]